MGFLPHSLRDPTCQAEDKHGGKAFPHLEPPRPALWVQDREASSRGTSSPSRVEKGGLVHKIQQLASSPVTLGSCFLETSLLLSGLILISVTQALRTDPECSSSLVPQLLTWLLEVGNHCDG